MAGAYWKYGEGIQQPNPLAAQPAKRPRSDYVLPSGQSPDTSAYFPLKDDRPVLSAIRDTDSINASYDRYLKSTQLSSFGADAGRSHSSAHHPVDEPRVVGMGVSEPALIEKGHPVGLGGRPEIPLPPDASSTLFVEGLPSNCTRREVSHIFRPFVGYKEVRLIMKDSRHPGGDPLVFCFVDFESPAHAATAMVALQGYKFDENDRDSVNLRIQFARYPGARSGGAHRGKTLKPF